MKQSVIIIAISALISAGVISQTKTTGLPPSDITPLTNMPMPESPEKIPAARTLFNQVKILLKQADTLLNRAPLVISQANRKVLKALHESSDLLNKLKTKVDMRLNPKRIDLAYPLSHSLQGE